MVPSQRPKGWSWRRRSKGLSHTNLGVVHLRVPVKVPSRGSCKSSDKVSLEGLEFGFVSVFLVFGRGEVAEGGAVGYNCKI